MSILLKNKQAPFWVLTIAIIGVLTWPTLIQHAMFQDGMLYSCVSHNMSLGFGNFWFPQYSTLNIEGIASFHEQPPLVFGIQALFFKLFGSSIYVERTFVLITILLHIYLINELWKLISFKQENHKKLGWIAALLWIFIPVCFWSFRSNMMENTLSVFSLLAIITSLKNITHQKVNWYRWILPGFFIFLASFSKGLPGLFPLTFPFLYWLIIRKTTFKQTIVFSIVLFAVPAFIYFLFYLNPTSQESLRIYVVERLLRRVSDMPTTDSRWETPWRLFQELIPLMSVTFLTYIFTLKRKGEFTTYAKESLLFFAIGLSAILPLMLTMVQKGWYMVPGFPFLAIGFALFILPATSKLIVKLIEHTKYLNLIGVFSVVFFISVLVFTGLQKDKISRHQEMVEDVFEIGKVVPRFATLTVPEEMYYQYDFILQGFLVRYYNISISPEKEYTYFLKEKTSDAEVPDGYEEISLDLKEHLLFKHPNRPTKELTAQPK